jgi:hypothetical protein
MNDMFGMTYERLEEIQDQIRAIGTSLDPLFDQAKARMDGYDQDEDVETVEEARLIAAGGLLARLQQALIETDFFVQGMRAYMDEEELDMETCTRISKVVVDAYGGMRDASDPYGIRALEETIRQTMSGSGLRDLLSGLGMVVVTTSRSGTGFPGEAA